MRSPALLPLPLLLPLLLGACAFAGDGASFTADTFPASLRPGEEVEVNVSARNTGTTTWTRADGYKLAAGGDQDPLYPRPRVWLPVGVSVAPGQTHTFTFRVTGPAQPGEHVSDWQLVKEGVHRFGPVLERRVRVVPPPRPNDAQLVASSFPTHLRPGERAQATLTFRNAGTTTWTRAGGYKLAAGGDQDPFHPRPRVWLDPSASVAPGQNASFVFELLAPTQPGTYRSDWQLVKEGVTRFGEVFERALEVGVAPQVDASTATGKLIMGYQGWFSCPGDGGLDNWLHWFRRPASSPNLTVDMWPDLRELDPDEKFPTPLTLASGAPAEVFSSVKQKTVVRHFAWMREHGLDGVALQRFTAPLARDGAVFRFRNEVARNVRAGAEAHGRVFYVMYDISGHDPQTLVEDLKRDWRYVVETLQLTQSDRYLRHRGKPLLAIWGLGFTDRPGTAAEAMELVRWFRQDAPPAQRATLMGGVPTQWRSLRGDSKSDPRWADVYRSFSIISPWSVGRYADDAGADRFLRDQIRPDLAEARKVGADYMPVVWPGFSWKNLKPNGVYNQIPRRGGRFYWRQVYNALSGGCDMLYGAMFDEVDEATAMFKTVETRASAPVENPTVALDADGESLPSDWYLRLAGEATKALRGQRTLGPRRPIDP